MASTFHKRIKLGTMERSRTAAGASPTSLVIRFYDHNLQAKDSRGRTQEDIVSWSDSKLESCHNYIQILFPLPEGSPFYFEAPVINREVFDAFRSRSELRSRLRRSYERMLEFYGFTLCSMVKGGTRRQGDSEKDSDASTTDYTIDASVTSVIDNGTVSSCSNVKKDCPITTMASEPSTPLPTGYSIVRGPKWRNNASRWCVRFDHNHLRITRILRCLRVLGLQNECDAFYRALQDVFDDPAIHIGDRSMMYWTRAVQRPLSMAPDDEECEWLLRWESEQKREAKLGNVARGQQSFV